MHVYFAFRRARERDYHHRCLVTWCLECRDAIKIQNLIFAREYRMLISDHFSKDAANTPDINWGGIVLWTKQQLWWSVPQCDNLEGKGEKRGGMKGKDEEEGESGTKEGRQGRWKGLATIASHNVDYQQFQGLVQFHLLPFRLLKIKMCHFTYSTVKTVPK